MLRIYRRSLALCVAGLALVLGLGVLGDRASAASLSDELVENPEYLRYLEDVRAGNGAKWKLIPSQYLTTGATKSREGKGGGDLPAKYNLVDAGFATVIKNQGVNGDCWTYATTTAMESYMKKVKGIDIEFSPKQLDYALTSSTRYGQYLENVFELPAHELGGGGNFILSTIGLKSKYLLDKEEDFFARMKANDATLATYNSFREYNDVTSMLSLITGVAYNKEMTESQILGDKAEYVVDGTRILQGYYGDAEDIVAEIKEAVYRNGAVYVGTFAPGTEGCWDEDSKTLVDRGFDVCGEENGHALAIIGWDDNHEYEYLGANGESGEGMVSSLHPKTRGAEDSETRTGAFIVQNSYGKSSLLRDYGLDSLEEYLEFFDLEDHLEGMTEEEIYMARTTYSSLYDDWGANEYFYLGYDFSEDTQFGMITSMSKNDFTDVYDATMAEVEISPSVMKFKMPVEAGKEQVITKVGLDLAGGVEIPIEFGVGVDSNNDGVAESAGKISFDVGDGGGRKVIKLATPVPVSDDFTVLVTLGESTLQQFGQENLYFDEGSDLFVSALAYGEEIDDEEIVVPETAAATNDAKTPPTGVFTGGGQTLVVVAPFVLVFLGVMAVSVYNLKDRAVNSKRIRFEKRK